jgi:hypothetical protein
MHFPTGSLPEISVAPQPSVSYALASPPAVRPHLLRQCRNHRCTHRRHQLVAVFKLPRINRLEIGPFATRKDAEAMRQRVLADGFNAIVK